MSRFAAVLPLLALTVCAAKPPAKGMQLETDISWSVSGVVQKPREFKVEKGAAVNLEHLFSFPVQGDWLINTKSKNYWLMMLSSKRIISDEQFARMDRREIYDQFRTPRTFPVEGIQRHQLTLLNGDKEVKAINNVKGSYTVRSEQRGLCNVFLFSLDAVFTDGAVSYPVHAEGFSSECPGT